MAPFEIVGIVAVVVLYLLFRAFNGPKLSDGRGREYRNEPENPDEVADSPPSIPDTKDSILMSPSHL